jgi:tubulin polyglutamylase TTLL4
MQDLLRQMIRIGYYIGTPKKNFVKKLNKFQKINHFPGCWELGRKDNLWYT